MKTSPKLGALVAVGALVLALPLAGATAAAAEAPIVVSIRAALDLPASSQSLGPIVYEVKDVIAGEGPELTEADLVSNPSDWCGTLDVDVDPIAKTIAIYTAPESRLCDFQTVSVTVISDQIGAITLTSDTLLDQELCPDEEGDEGDGPIPSSNEISIASDAVELVDNGVWTFDYTSENHVVQLDWATIPVDDEGGSEAPSLYTCGITVLNFTTVAAVAPAAPVLAETGSDNSLTIAGLAAAVLLLGAAAVAASTVSRRSVRD